MRKPRFLIEGGRYHVIARTNHKEKLLQTPRIKELFISIIRRGKKRHAFSIESFCIMDTHVHFIIRPGKGESLSRIMQWILGVFAMAYNRYRGWTGHFWGGRFFSSLIRSFESFSSVFQYIQMNPVKALLVRNPCDWEFSYLWHSRHGRSDIIEKPPQWLLMRYPMLHQILLPAPIF
jgi:putative transposase